MFIPSISRLMASQCCSQSPIKSSRLKDVLSRSSFAFLVLVLNGETGEREGEMERSWVMDALCVSVIPNYWTLPFKASLRCISHFCLSDWWRAGSDWGALCVLNTASLVIHYLLQIQYTAADAPRSPLQLSPFVFVLMFRYQMYSFPYAQVCYSGTQRKMRLHIMFF